MTKEEWKDIKDYEGLYQVSNLGRIKSLGRYKNNWSKKQWVEERILKQRLANTGYYMVVLSKNGKVKGFLVHRLVAETFIPNPENKPQVNHKDENKLNNHIENLEFCTRKYNCNYGTKMERQKEKLGKSVIQYDRNMTCINIYSSITKASQTTKINLGNIAKCCKNERKTAGGYIWKYN